MNAVIEQGRCVTVNNACQWTSTGVMGTVNDVEWGNNRMDWERIRPPSPNTIEQVVFVQGPNSLAGANEFSFVGAAHNQQVCADGAFTGENCTGRVYATNGCIRLSDDAGNIILVCNQTFAASSNDTRLVQHGDSGGPVLGLGTTSRIGLGIISGGNVGPGGNGTDMNFTDGAAICNRTPGC